MSSNVPGNGVEHWLLALIAKGVDEGIARFIARGGLIPGQARTAARDEDAVITLPDLAKRWTVSPAYLRALRKSGALPVTRFGTRVLVRREDVLAIERAGLPSTGDGRRKAGRGGASPIFPQPAAGAD